MEMGQRGSLRIIGHVTPYLITQDDRDFASGTRKKEKHFRIMKVVIAAYCVRKSGHGRSYVHIKKIVLLCIQKIKNRGIVLNSLIKEWMSDPCTVLLTAGNAGRDLWRWNSEIRGVP